MSAILVRLTKHPEFESALMSLDDAQLNSLGRRIEDYIGLTGMVSTASLEISMQIFRWTDRDSRLKYRVSGHVNNTPFDRVIDTAERVAELPPSFWLSPRRLVKAAIISAVVPKADIGKLRVKWRASMIDRIEIASRECIDNALGRIGSPTTKSIQRILMASKIIGFIGAAAGAVFAFQVDAAPNVHERLFGGVLFGAISGVLAAGAVFLLFSSFLIRAKDMVNDPAGRRIMSIIGVETPAGLRRATIFIGALFLSLLVLVFLGLPYLPRKR